MATKIGQRCESTTPAIDEIILNVISPLKSRDPTPYVLQDSSFNYILKDIYSLKDNSFIVLSSLVDNKDIKVEKEGPRYKVKNSDGSEETFDSQSNVSGVMQFGNKLSFS